MEHSKLAIITTHPIQYNAPWFRLLAERNQIQIKVFYTWSQSQTGDKYDPGFGKNIAWDIPLLDGYEYEFVTNISKTPGTRSHKGIINPGLIKAIEEWQPDAVLVFGWNFRSHLQCLRHFHKKIPVLFRGDSTLQDEPNGIRKMLRKWVLKWVYRHVDYALYVGTENKNYFIRFGLKEHQLVFVPHAIDNKRFATCASRSNMVDALRRQAGICEDEFVFLFAGKLEPKKNPELLIEAFNKTSFQKNKLVIAGNGILESELKKKYVYQKNIAFLDFQNQQQMPAVYQLASVFVLPSQGPGETWGLAINEAMAAQKPVLVSDRCGCAIDLVEDGKNGFVFQSGNMNDLVEKIKLMFGDKQLLKEMGASSLQKIQDWSFEKIASQVEDLMEKL